MNPSNPTSETGLLQNIAALLAQKQVPFEEQLWTADDIAAHLQVSPRTVGEKYAPLPGFPRAARLGGGVRRWYAHEILDWVRSTRQPKSRAARTN
jgi:predicted DNA-binding transcriptional regulator AlpA